MIQIRHQMAQALRLANQGLLEQAVEEYAEVLKKDPANIDACAQLARCYRALGQHDEALVLLKRSVGLSPDPRAINGIIHDLGCCYLEKSELGPALEHLNTAIKLWAITRGP